MIDLQSFCAAPDDQRNTWLQAPFSRGEFTYATNGAYGVRVSRQADVPELESPKAAQTLDGFFKPIEGATFESVAHITLPDTQEEVTKTPCDSCDGRGHEHDCPNCECKCEDCGGTREVTVIGKISVAAFGDNYRLPYLRKILALPGVQIAALPRNPEKSPALFRFDGGVAALIPLWSPYRHHIDVGAKTEPLAEGFQ